MGIVRGGKDNGALFVDRLEDKVLFLRSADVFSSISTIVHTPWVPYTITSFTWNMDAVLPYFLISTHIITSSFENFKSIFTQIYRFFLVYYAHIEQLAYIYGITEPVSAARSSAYS
jgi:hypothetical protein